MRLTSRSQNYWGNGYATEGLAAALISMQSTAKKGKQLIPVHASFMPQNIASKHVLEKCGFVVSDPPNGGVNSAGLVWYHWPISAPRWHHPK